MERDKRWLLWFLAFLVLGLAVLRPTWGWRIRDFFSSDRGAGGEASDLALENQTLRTELLKLQNLRDFYLGESKNDYLPAFIYSRYPFSLKDEVFLDKGGEDGVRVDQPVLVVLERSSEDSKRSGILVGKVSKVFSQRSVVVTVFDDRWSSPVGIGKARAQALLNGGGRPKLVLIDKTAVLKDGDLVYNLDESFPEGLPIGTITNLRLAEDHLFFEADLEVAYNLGELPLLWVLKN